MSFKVKVGGRVLSVPRQMEAVGGKAVEEWIAAQLAPAPEAPKAITRGKKAPHKETDS